MMKRIQNWLKASGNEDGQGMIEYALIISGIALIALVGIQLLGPGLDALFDTITAAL